MLKTIFERRSIRKYKNTPVEQDKINEILKAAMYSPTGKNTQLWQFILVDDREIMAKFQENHPYASMLESAPCMIIVCGDMEKNPIPYYYMGDCGAAAQTILLAAHDLGLGTCWMGIAPSEERIKVMSSLFNLPQTIIPFCAIALGYADEEKPMPQRFDGEKIHHNKW